MPADITRHPLVVDFVNEVLACWKLYPYVRLSASGIQGFSQPIPELLLQQRPSTFEDAVLFAIGRLTQLELEELVKLNVIRPHNSVHPALEQLLRHAGVGLETTISQRQHVLDSEIRDGDPPATYTSLGDLIRRRMRQLALTRMQLAQAVGVSETSIGNWVRDQRRPRLEHHIPLCRALGISPDLLEAVLESGDQLIARSTARMEHYSAPQ